MGVKLNLRFCSMLFRCAGPGGQKESKGERRTEDAQRPELACADATVPHHVDGQPQQGRDDHRGEALRLRLDRENRRPSCLIAVGGEAADQDRPPDVLHDVEHCESGDHDPVDPVVHAWQKCQED